nr:radical SAM protein [Duganella sp. 1411]
MGNLVAQHKKPAHRYAHISVILKVTERCNLACPYCYFFFGGDESYKTHPPLMGAVTVEQVIRFVKDMKQATGINLVRIGLHGGEPLLMKRAALQAMCSALRAALGDEPELTLVLQTNGVLVDAGWIDLFEELRIRVGVSFDGPPEVHDKTRITKGGEGSYAESLRGWNLLREAALAGRIEEPSILCVVAPNQDGGMIFRHFVETMKAKALSFLLPDLTHDAVPLNRAVIEGCTRFLLGLAEAWASSTERGLYVRLIDEFVGPILNDELYKRKAMLFSPSHQVCVSSNGELCPDDVIRTYSPEFAETGLTVDGQGYDDVLAHPAWRTLQAAQTSLPAACRGCEWSDICGGGLLQHRYSRRRGFDNPSIYCSSLKALYEYLTRVLVNSGCSRDDMQDRIRRLATRHEEPVAQQGC